MWILGKLKNFLKKLKICSSVLITCITVESLISQYQRILNKLKSLLGYLAKCYSILVWSLGITFNIRNVRESAVHFILQNYKLALIFLFYICVTSFSITWHSFVAIIVGIIFIKQKITIFNFFGYSIDFAKFSYELILLIFTNFITELKNTCARVQSWDTPVFNFILYIVRKFFNYLADCYISLILECAILVHSVYSERSMLAYMWRNPWSILAFFFLLWINLFWAFWRVSTIFFIWWPFWLVYFSMYAYFDEIKEIKALWTERVQHPVPFYFLFVGILQPNGLAYLGIFKVLSFFLKKRGEKINKIKLFVHLVAIILTRIIFHMPVFVLKTSYKQAQCFIVYGKKYDNTLFDIFNGNFMARVFHEAIQLRNLRIYKKGGTKFNFDYNRYQNFE